MEPDGRYRPESWISEKAEEGIPLRPKSKEGTDGHRFRELQRLNRVYGKATWGKRNGVTKIKLRNRIVTHCGISLIRGGR